MEEQSKQPVTSSERREPDQQEREMVTLSGCSCETSSTSIKPVTSQNIYVLGALGVDFGSESRRDSLAQHVTGGSIDQKTLLDYLKDNPEESERLLFTVNKPSGPVYVVRPTGAYAHKGYESLINALKVQSSWDTKKQGPFVAAIPGYMNGYAHLLSGQTVPIISPSIMGMFRWDDPSDIVLSKYPKETATKKKKAADTITDFRNRILRNYDNLGVTGSDRALNYVATKSFIVLDVIDDFIDLHLDYIDVHKSAISRSGSDCYDVTVKLFDQEDVKKPLIVARFTVDVSDVIPVVVSGIAPSVWTERPRR